MTPTQIIRGQDNLTEQWRRRLAQLRDGAGGILLLHGPESSGKTALLHHFCDVATGLGIRHVRPGNEGKTLLGQLASSMDLKGTDPIPAIVAELGTTPALLAVDGIHTYSTEDIYGISQLMREILTRKKFQPVILVLTSSTVRGRVEPIVTGATTGTELELLPIRPIDTQAAISLVKSISV